MEEKEMEEKEYGGEVVAVEIGKVNGGCAEG